MVSPVRARRRITGPPACLRALKPTYRCQGQGRSAAARSGYLFMAAPQGECRICRGQGRYVTPGTEPYRVNASFGAYHAELVFLRGWPVQSARADPPCPARDAAQPPVRDPALLYPITIGGVPNCIPRTGLLLSRSALMTAGLQAAISPISGAAPPRPKSTLEPAWRRTVSVPRGPHHRSPPVST